MKRLLIAFIVVTAAEFWAFMVFRDHPISRPSYFPALLTGIQFLMSYGGIESARWLLRRSPVSRCPGPESDWARLWLWIGLPGGVMMILTSVLAWAVAGFTPSWIPPALVLAHAAGGGILWLCATVEVIPQLARLPRQARQLNGNLAMAGLIAHLLGIWCYTRLYPAGQLQVGLFLVAVLLVYFVFYYVWTACLWWMLVFRFWTPPQVEEDDAGRG